MNVADFGQLNGIILSVITYSLIAKWYVMPSLRRIPVENALILLLLLHTTRHIGMGFLIPGVTAEALDPRFAIPAAYGDFLAAILAFVAIGALRMKWAIAIPLVWIFNLEGTLDLLNAVTQGRRFVKAGDMGAMYFIPILVVPALLVTHFMVFVLLLKPKLHEA